MFRFPTKVRYLRQQMSALGQSEHLQCKMASLLYPRKRGMCSAQRMSAAKSGHWMLKRKTAVIDSGHVTGRLEPAIHHL